MLPKPARLGGYYWLAWLAVLLLAGNAQARTVTASQCRVLQALGEQREPATRPAIVIIIDDIGLQLALGRAAAALPGKLNLAVLPFSPHGVELARIAHEAGKEVLLHVPMSNQHHTDPGPGALTPELSQAEFEAAFSAARAQVPFARGVNNHMGSELTERPTQMRWLMLQLAKEGLYFVDSRTSDKTIAAEEAAANGLPHLSRHVFLDNERSIAAIDKSFRRLIALARRDGLAVAIGHPYPETIAYLRQALPRLGARGLRLALVSEVTGLAPAPRQASTPAAE